MTKLKALWLYIVDTWHELIDTKSDFDDTEPAPCKCGYKHTMVVRERIDDLGGEVFFVACLNCNRSIASHKTASAAVRDWNHRMRGMPKK